MKKPTRQRLRSEYIRHQADTCGCRSSMKALPTRSAIVSLSEIMIMLHQRVG
jgi:hypothetical protein